MCRLPWRAVHSPSPCVHACRREPAALRTTRPVVRYLDRGRRSRERRDRSRRMEIGRDWSRNWSRHRPGPQAPASTASYSQVLSSRETTSTRETAARMQIVLCIQRNASRRISMRYTRSSSAMHSKFAVALLATIPAAAMAADNSGSDESIDEIVVTGSYIEGVVEDAAMPVTVLGRDEIESRGSPSVLELIRSLPAAQGTVGESNPGGVFLGTGAVGVNLRGFDGGRTLVLFNGKRLPVSPVPLLGVDVNLVPIGAIERI